MQVFAINMIKWYIIIIVSLWLYFPEVAGARRELTRSPDDVTGQAALNTEPAQQAEIFFAQNEKKKTTDSVPADDTVKTDEDATKGKTGEKAKKAPEGTKKLKPFVPSEKIPADQGVDFPYDI
jgi:hypothetical protein